MKKVFIDGSAGTTGLRIQDRLKARSDIALLVLEERFRKDAAARRAALNEADVAFLCLPDAAAVEAVEMVTGDTVVIDTSTAHRTAKGWVYGFPELTGRRDAIRQSRRIANPGCHASGFIALIAPLVEKGVLDAATALSAFSLTGYSGGGKKMIANYAVPENAAFLQAPRMYGLSQSHKHLPEMQKLCGLQTAPVFCPIVSSYYAGMEVVIPLFASQLSASTAELKALYADYYTEGLVRFCDGTDENGFLSAGALAGHDTMEIGVFGNNERILLVSRFDNLGKGASGAAIQNMNLVLGVEETQGLVL